MNCDWVQQNICLYLYNELADDARHEVEQHIQRCKDCAAELAAQQEFQAEMNAVPVALILVTNALTAPGQPLQADWNGFAVGKSTEMVSPVT